MGEDVTAKGAVGIVAVVNLIAPCGAVGRELFNIHHNGVGLLRSLTELGNACKLGSGRCARGRGVNGGISAVNCIAVAIDGAMTLRDFAGQVVYRV